MSRARAVGRGLWAVGYGLWAVGHRVLAPRTAGGERPVAHGSKLIARGPQPARTASALLLLTLAACGGQGSGSGSTPTASPAPTVAGGVAAIVNGNSIPLWSYRFYVHALQQQVAGQGISAAAIAAEAMTQVLGDEMVREYAVAHGLDATQAEINARVASDEKQFKGKAGLEKRLKPFGLTFDQYLVLTATGVRRHNVAVQVAPIAYAHVRHILIGTSLHRPSRSDAAAHALAQSILRQLQHGGDFVALARRYSDDATGKHGGDLGSFCPGRMVPPFDQASFTAPIGKPTLVHSQYGYHILEVLSRVPATAQECPTQQLADPEQGPAFIAWIHAQIKLARVKKLVAG